MIKKATFVSLLAAALAGTVFAQEKDPPKGIPHLDRVFVILMENHGYQQVVGNENQPYLNDLITRGKVNLATNYYAVGHPSLTNYLEVVGGSNFGVQSDNNPAWHSACAPNLASGSVATDTPPTPAICPIWGTGTDAVTPAKDCTNEVSGPPCENNIDGTASIASS